MWRGILKRFCFLGELNKASENQHEQTKSRGLGLLVINCFHLPRRRASIIISPWVHHPHVGITVTLLVTGGVLTNGNHRLHEATRLTLTALDTPPHTLYRRYFILLQRLTFFNSSAHGRTLRVQWQHARHRHRVLSVWWLCAGTGHRFPPSSEQSTRLDDKKRISSPLVVVLLLRVGACLGLV